MNDLFAAVIGGVSVFIASQYLHKFIFDPLLEFKKITTEISHALLLNQAKILNAGPDEEELKSTLHSLSSRLRGYTRMIPFYSFLYLTRMFNLPDKKNILKACHCLNIIGYGVVDMGMPREKKIQENAKAIEQLRVLLNIETTYTQPVDKP